MPADVKAAWTREPGRARAGYANVAEFLRKYSEAGGKILAATDTGCCAQIVPGLSLHYEMQMLTDIGITPMKAIQGATLWAAEVIGQQKDLGSVEAGKLADFAIIEGNPLARHRRDEERAHGDQGRRGDGYDATTRSGSIRSRAGRSVRL